MTTRIWDGTQWVVLDGPAGEPGATDHGELQGLTGDDHPQYAAMVSQGSQPPDPVADRPTLWFDTDAPATPSPYPDSTGQPANRVAETDGADGWTFIPTPSGGSGLPTSAKWVWATPDDYPSIDPTGTSDSLAGFQSFFAAIPDGGVGVVPGGTYLMSAHVNVAEGKSVTILAHGATFLVSGVGNFVQQRVSREVTYNVSSVSTLQVTDYSHGAEANWVTRLTLSSGSPTWVAGDVVQLFADDIATADVSTANVRSGETFVVAGVTGSQVDLAGRPYSPYTTNVRVARYGQERLTWHGGTFRHTDTVLGGGTQTGSTFYLNGGLYPVVKDVRIEAWSGPAIYTRRTFGARIENVTIDWAVDTSPVFGYGVLDSGTSTRVSSLSASRVRHAYATGGGTTVTAGNTDARNYGLAMGARISDSSVIGATQGAWDTHGDAVDVHFANCTATDSYCGFILRGVGHRIQGGYVKNAVFTGVDIGTASSSQFTYDHVVGGGLVLDNCSGYGVRVYNNNAHVETRPVLLDGIIVTNRPATAELIRADSAYVQVGFVVSTDGSTATEVANNGKIIQVGSSSGGPVITPDDYGAVGDGVADDTTALVDAAAAMTDGATFLVPAGKTYRHTDNFSISGVRDIRVTGTGEIAHDSDVDETGSFGFLNCVGIQVDSITLSSTATTRRSGSASHRVFVYQSRDVVIRDLTINGSAAAGILLDAVEHFEIRDCSLSSTLADSIHMTHESAFGHISGITSDGSGDDGVAIVSYDSRPTPCHDIHIRDVTVTNQVGGRAIGIVGAEDVLVEKVTATNIANAGIYIACESSYSTLGVKNVHVRDVAISQSNQSAPGTEMGPIMVYSGRDGFTVENVLVENTTVSDTNAANSISGYQVITYSPTAKLSRIELRDIDITSGNHGGPGSISGLEKSWYNLRGITFNAAPRADEIGWASSSPIPPGGAAGQLLTKASAVDYDLGWTTPSTITDTGSVSRLIVLGDESGTSSSAWTSKGGGFTITRDTTVTTIGDRATSRTPGETYSYSIVEMSGTTIGTVLWSGGSFVATGLEPEWVDVEVSPPLVLAGDGVTEYALLVTTTDAAGMQIYDGDGASSTLPEHMAWASGWRTNDAIANGTNLAQLVVTTYTLRINATYPSLATIGYVDTAVDSLKASQPGDTATHGFRIWAGSVTTDSNGYTTVPMASIGIDNSGGDVRLWVSLEFSKSATGGVAGDQPHWAAIRSIGADAEIVIYSMQRSGAEVDQLTSRYGSKSANVTILAYGKTL